MSMHLETEPSRPYRRFYPDTNWTRQNFGHQKNPSRATGNTFSVLPGGKDSFLPSVKDRRVATSRSPLPPRSKSREAIQSARDISPFGSRNLHGSPHKPPIFLNSRSRSAMRLTRERPTAAAVAVASFRTDSTPSTSSFTTIGSSSGSSSSSSRRNSNDKIQMSETESRSSPRKKVRYHRANSSGAGSFDANQRVTPIPLSSRRTLEMVTNVDMSDSHSQFSGSHISKNIQENFKGLLPKVSARRPLKKFHQNDQLEVCIEPMLSPFNIRSGPCLLPFQGSLKSKESSLQNLPERRPVLLYCLIESSADMIGSRIIAVRKLIKWLARTLSADCQMQVIELADDNTKKYCSLLSLNDFQRAEVGRCADSIICSGEKPTSETFVESLVHARQTNSKVEKKIFVFTTSGATGNEYGGSPSYINEKVYENFTHLTVFDVRPANEALDQLNESDSLSRRSFGRVKTIGSFEDGQVAIAGLIPQQFPVIARNVEFNLKANSICPNGEFELVQMVSLFDVTSSKCSTGFSYTLNIERYFYGMEFDFVAILKQKRKSKKAPEAKVLLPVINEEEISGQDFDREFSPETAQRLKNGMRSSVLNSSLCFTNVNNGLKQYFRQDYSIPITTKEQGQPRTDNSILLYDYYSVKVLEVLRLAEISNLNPFSDDQLSREMAMYTREEFEADDLRKRPQLQQLIMDLEHGLSDLGF